MSMLANLLVYPVGDTFKQCDPFGAARWCGSRA
jgi:hypothetical protein